MPVYTPPAPPPLPQDTIQPYASLPPDQEAMYETVLENFSKEDYTLPGSEEGKGGLMEEEKFWLSRECILRYLRAVKWHAASLAIKRLEETLQWRRAFGIHEMKASHIEPELVTGKMFILGYDTERRPALYILFSHKNTDETHRYIEAILWFLERTLDLAGPGVESLILLIDYGAKGKTPSMHTCRTVLHIVQNHYPERLGACLVLNEPFLFNAFYRIISPFIDPVVHAKLRFNPSPITDGLFTKEQLLEANWGGRVDFEYEHGKYFGHMVGMCEERKESQMRAWTELGGGVGISEWDFKTKAEGQKAEGEKAEKALGEEQEVEETGETGVVDDASTN